MVLVTTEKCGEIPKAEGKNSKCSASVGEWEDTCMSSFEGSEFKAVLQLRN
jgi:hypothetical protein